MAKENRPHCGNFILTTVLQLSIIFNFNSQDNTYRDIYNAKRHIYKQRSTKNDLSACESENLLTVYRENTKEGWTKKKTKERREDQIYLDFIDNFN